MNAPEVREVHINTNVDWQNAIVTFKEMSSNGVALLNQPAVQVPLELLVKIVAQAMERTLSPGIRAMNFIPTERPARPPTSPIVFGANIRGQK